MSNLLLLAGLYGPSLFFFNKLPFKVQILNLTPTLGVPCLSVSLCSPSFKSLHY